MFRRIVVYICSLLLFVFPAGAEGLSRERKAVKVSGDVLLAAMPVATVATVLAMKDWTGPSRGFYGCDDTRCFLFAEIYGKEGSSRS